MKNEVEKNEKLLLKALSAKRESRQIEFKRRFDPRETGPWCEVIKDIVAIANSGGGIMIFGLDDFGTPTGDDIEAILKIDPADCTNRVFKYTGANFEYEIRQTEKQGHQLAAFIIPRTDMPLVFHKPGVYAETANKSQTAFHMGTVYFRHGAKSEPGTTEDIARVVNRKVDEIRKSWVSGVRKVVEAPAGAEIIAVPINKESSIPSALATDVRTVNDPKAFPVRLTREPIAGLGKFVHEEVSEALLQEINNVIDVNRLLAGEKRRFVLSQPVYFRVYAERQHAKLTEADANLLQRASTEFYAPGLYWLRGLPDAMIAQNFKEAYGRPQSHGLVRFAALLGKDFAAWLWQNYQKAWDNHPQPPSVFWTIKKMPIQLQDTDPRIVASRLSPSSTLSITEEKPYNISELLDNPEKAAVLLSKACMQVSKGNDGMRSATRVLDYLAYGAEIMQRSQRLSRSIVDLIGNQNLPITLDSQIDVHSEMNSE